MSNKTSREAVFQARIMEVLGALTKQWPSLSVRIDLWRPAVVSRLATEFGDESTEVWVRLDENVPAFYVQSQERWFEKEVGVIRQMVNSVILPGGIGVRVGDHVFMNGTSWMVVDCADQAGIAKLKIDEQKSRWVPQSRLDPVYRQQGIRARIA